MNEMDLEDRAGLGRDTVREWRYRCNPGIANFEAALNVLGYELCIKQKKDVV